MEINTALAIILILIIIWMWIDHKSETDEPKSDKVEPEKPIQTPALSSEPELPPTTDIPKPEKVVIPLDSVYSYEDNADYGFILPVGGYAPLLPRDYVGHSYKPRHYGRPHGRRMRSGSRGGRRR